MTAGTHTCPGLCGRRVADRLFACPQDWERLPRDLQVPIVDTRNLTLLSPERLAAVQDARRWYRDHWPRRRKP